MARRRLLVLAAIPAVLALAWLALVALSGWRLRQQVAAYQPLLPPAPPAAATPPDDAARRWEEAGLALLGCRLLGPDECRITGLDWRLQRELETYSTRWRDAKVTGYGPAPQRVVELLDARSAEVSRLRELGRGGDPPRYGIDPSSHRWPWLRPVVVLHEVLVADALHQAQRGEPLLARESLAAASALHRGLREQPHLVHALVEASLASSHAAALREVGGERAAAAGLYSGGHARMLDAWRHSTREDLDAWSTLGGILRASPVPLSPPERAARMALLPLARWQLASVLAAQRADLARLLEEPACGTAGHRGPPSPALPALPGLETLDPLPLAGPLQRAAMTELQVELTALVLVLEESRDPAALDLASRACPGQSWQVEAQPDGLARLLGPRLGAADASRTEGRRLEHLARLR